MLTFTGTDSNLVVAPDEFFTAEQEQMLLQMCRPEGRKDLSGSLKAMRENEQAMMQQATEQQKTAGTPPAPMHWRRRWPGPMPGETGARATTIYGEIRTMDQLFAAERQAGAGPAEARRTVRSLREGWARGWRPSRCYSVIEPDGETGYVHVGVMELLTAEEFETARAAGWPEVQ